MQRHIVKVIKRIESAKFGIVIPENTSGLTAWKEHNRYYVEHPQDSTIRLVVDANDIEVENYHG